MPEPSPLSVVLDPRSVAVIGASDDRERIGGRPIFYLQRGTFAGAVYPVNPNRDTVQGLTAYPDVASLPEAPEVAIIAVGGAGAQAAVEACAAKGVKVAIVMSSGFGEVDDAGKELERQMVATARAAGMRMLGPNCYGVANLATGATLTFSTALRDGIPPLGPVAIVSQSGSMSVAPIPLLARRGIGVRGIYGTGNDADVSVAELAVEVARDPAVELLLLYFESVRDAGALAELARVARERDLPVVALKAGRTPAGMVAASSHTGALANEDRVVDAFLAKHGIWRARDLDDLVLAPALHLGRWTSKGRNTVVLSNSGASCVQAADAAFDAGLPVDPLADETRAALGEVLPGFATTTNPIDLTAALLGNSGFFSEVLPIAGRDPKADAFLIALPVAGEGYDVARFAADSGAFSRETGKPLVLAAPQDDVALPFEAEGIPRFVTEAEAVRALAQVLGANERRAAALRRSPSLVRRVVAAGAEVLDEAAGLALAATFGVGVVPHRLCATPDDAVAALRELGGPVVLKGCSARAPHKTELGLVRLRLDGDDAVRAAAEDVLGILAGIDPDAPGVVVASMARGLELLVGAHVDPVFGPVVLVGAGGTNVEVLPDVQVLLPPFDAQEVREALGRLRMAPLLAGVRGEKPADVDAFVETVLAAGRLVLDDDAGIVSLDLNPVFVGPVGSGCAAADAVVERAVREG